MAGVCRLSAAGGEGEERDILLLSGITHPFNETVDVEMFAQHFRGVAQRVLGFSTAH